MENPVSFNNTKKIGQQGEALALHFLQKQKLKLIKKNYCTRMGEIDLIMRDQSTYVFIEVRLRKNPTHGHSFETITHPKQQRIINTAKHFLLSHNLYDQVDCRFDVIGIEENQNIVWIQDAFQ